MQMIGIHSIEDCLEIITGLQQHNLKFEIDSSDSTIINSIARQVFKGTALTDRQYNLMKEKLSKYKEQFEEQEVIGFDLALSKLRNPLRSIDRSKYIKIVNTDDVNIAYETFSKELNWIKIRFPFNKKTIVILDRLAFKHKKHYIHHRGSHEHFFVLNERTTYDIVKAFKDKSFDIDKEILEHYKKIDVIKRLPEENLSCIIDGKLFNTSEDLKNKLNLEKLIDRKRRHGIVSFENKKGCGLKSEIIYRDTSEVLVKPSQYNLQNVAEVIYNLDRFPLLVILDEQNCEEQIFEIWQEFKNIVSSSQQSVLFRQEGISEFNKFVKNKKLNNWVDKNTKIVYINSNKLPKVLINAEWKPITSLDFSGGFVNRFIDTYIKDKCDLILHREEELSHIRKYSRYYG